MTSTLAMTNKTPEKPILIVDDDPDFASGLADVLEVHGFECDVVHSGEEALEKCEHNDYSLVLMDVKMHGMSGVEAYLSLKRNGVKYPVVLISAYSEAELLNQALKVGATAVMQKPFEPHLLIELLEKRDMGRRVLVIDDNVSFANSIIDFLKIHGYSGEMAESGSLALQMIEASKFDLILMDINLPDIMGPELARLIRKQRVETPICFVTAQYPHYGEKYDAISLQEVMRKPFETRFLIEKIQQLVKQNKGAQSQSS